LFSDDNCRRTLALIRHAPNFVYVPARSALPREVSGFKPLMHFSFYLMIAALVLVGFEVAYAIYQLTLFVL
jgi:hypothetical protein